MKTDELTGKYEVEESDDNGLAMAGAGYEANQNIVDNSDLRKYRIELPNLYDDADLDPYEFRLLAHYKRVGTCTESTRTTATKCHMSPAQVSVKRKSVRDKGFIEMEEVPSDKKEGEFFYSITVTDLWLQNFKKYSERLLSKRQRLLSKHSVHVVKQRSNHIKKEPIKEGASATPPKPPTPEEVKLFREVKGRYPNQATYELVTEKIQKMSARLLRPVTKEDLRPFYVSWTSKGYNPENLAWLDWAVSGVVPANAKIANVQEPKSFQGIRDYINSMIPEEVVNGFTK